MTRTTSSHSLPLNAPKLRPQSLPVKKYFLFLLSLAALPAADVPPLVNTNTVEGGTGKSNAKMAWVV